MNIDKISELLLRFFSRPKFYYGSITLKFQNGSIKNVIAEDSFDMKYLKEKKLNIEDKKMFTKFGTSTIKDESSSKIISELKIDEEKNIVKESKIKKVEVNAEDKEN